MADIFLSPTGNDDAAGHSNSPLATLKRAHEALQPGDKLWLRGGIHRCTGLQWTKGDVSIHAWPGEAPVIDLSTTVLWSLDGEVYTADLTGLAVSAYSNIYVFIKGIGVCVDCMCEQHFVERTVKPLPLKSITWYNKDTKRLQLKLAPGLDVPNPQETFRIVSSASQLNFSPLAGKELANVVLRGFAIQYGMFGIHIGSSDQTKVHHFTLSDLKLDYLLWGIQGVCNDLLIEDLLIDDIAACYFWFNNSWYRRWWQQHGIYLGGQRVQINDTYVGYTPSGSAMQTVGVLGARSSFQVNRMITRAEVLWQDIDAVCDDCEFMNNPDPEKLCRAALTWYGTRANVTMNGGSLEAPIPYSYVTNGNVLTLNWTEVFGKVVP